MRKSIRMADAQRHDQVGSSARSVVVTGASRGLGFVTAVRLYREGWRVVAAMRTPEKGMPLLREAADAGIDVDRLISVQLDLLDAESIAAAAKAIDAAVGPPFAIVHNAGIAAAGMVEETSMDLWQDMLTTHLIGPVALTKALLPAMRAAGRGRIVLISSAGGVRGQPAIAPYSAAKGALERWGESMAGEIASFGIGVTILVPGVYDTDIITDAGTTDERDFGGPYGGLHRTIDQRGRFAMKIARPPERFTDDVVKALDDQGPFCRRGAGADASMLLFGNRILPPIAMHHVSRIVMGIPGFAKMRGGAPPLTFSQRLMISAAQKLPPPVMQRLITVVMWASSVKQKLGKRQQAEA